MFILSLLIFINKLKFISYRVVWVIFVMSQAINTDPFIHFYAHKSNVSQTDQIFYLKFHIINQY